MPRPNNGPKLRWIDRRGAYYIVWYELGCERMRATGTVDRHEAEAALSVYRETGRLPDMGWARMQDQEQFVYFIGGDEGPIKIGVTNDPQKRLAQMQCGSPAKLRLFAVTSGGRKAEYLYHLRYRPHRMHGEWFAPDPVILAEIDRINAEAGAS